MKPPKQIQQKVLAVAVAISSAITVSSLILGSPAAQATSFKFGEANEGKIDWDTNLSYSAMWRVARQKDDKFTYRNTGDTIADATRYSLLLNADDGNNNFDRGLVQNKLSFVTEMDISWRDFGLFLRARGYYDDAYNGNTDHSEQDFLSYNSGNSPGVGGDTQFQHFPDGTIKQHEDRLEMMDYFFYAGGELPGDRLFDLRLGSQVINWGEATFTPGINGLQSRADLIARNTPGVEVKEILLPTGALYGQVDLVENVSFEAYYQYEWRETEFNGVGSYFSDTDMLGPGAQNLIVAVNDVAPLISVPLVLENEPSNDGQWGVALHWLTENGTDFGFYFVNAHNKTPLPQANTIGMSPLPVSYSILYAEDIKGYAASFTTVMGVTNVQAEVSYKVGAPMIDINNNVVEGDLVSAQLGGAYVMEPTGLWDDANLTFEVAAAYVDSHDSSELRFDDYALGVNLRLELLYLNLASGLDLKVPIFLARGLDGTIRENTLVEDATSFNITFDFIYLNNFSTKLGYTNFFDGGDNHLITDRDNVYINLAYSF